MKLRSWFAPLLVVALASNFFFVGTLAVAAQDTPRTVPGSIVSASAEVTTAINRGRVLRNQGNYDAALAAFDQVLINARATKDRTGEVQALVNMASVYRYQAGLTEVTENQSPPADLMKKSADLYEQAIRIAHEAKDKPGEAYAQLYLGVVLTGQTEYDKAFPHYETALKLFKEVNNQLYIARTNMFLGDTALHRKNQPELALKFYAESLSPYLATKYWGDAQYVTHQMDAALERLMTPPAAK